MKDRIIVALDLDFEEAVRLVLKLGSLCSFYKVGLSLFYQSFEKIIDFLKNHEKKVFLDLKLHDISYQVGKAVASLNAFEPDLLTVHAQAGKEAIRAAREAASSKTKIVAVTVLTSVGGGEEVLKRVLTLSDEAISSGADGIVCSGHEVSAFKQRYPEKIAVVPGIRFERKEKDDQKRVVLPEEAFRNGADYIVVGREITLSPDPQGVLLKLHERIGVKP